jgi:hypothetical protein
LLFPSSHAFPCPSKENERKLQINLATNRLLLHSVHVKSKLRRSTKLNRVVQIIVSTPGHRISRFQAAEIATHLLASNGWSLEVALYLASNPYRFGSTVTW